MTVVSDVAALRALLSQVPLSDAQLQKAEELIKNLSLGQLQNLGLTAPPKPKGLPRGLDKLQPEHRLRAVQSVITSLQYNHAPGYMYNVSKDRPFNVIMNTARDVLRDALPIKCIEAVFLGLLLTSSWHELDRLAVGFKSKCQGQAYRHIVLAVHHVPSGLWGALGISRRPDLQYKPLTYASLADLMCDYKVSYEGWGHTLYKIRVGLPVDHDPTYTGAVCWRYCNVSCGRHPWDRCRAILSAFAENTRLLANRFKVLGFRPPSRGAGVAEAGQGHKGPRIALSGTTPEPGAARPPPISTNARHGSVLPTRRHDPAATPGGDKSLQPGTAVRPGCVSAPPRPRADTQRTAASCNKAAAAKQGTQQLKSKGSLQSSSSLPSPTKLTLKHSSKRFSRVPSLAKRSSQLVPIIASDPCVADTTTTTAVITTACDRDATESLPALGTPAQADHTHDSLMENVLSQSMGSAPSQPDAAPLIGPRESGAVLDEPSVKDLDMLCGSESSDDSDGDEGVDNEC